MVAVTCVLPLFVAVKAAILPEPLAARPIAGVSLVQVNVLPVPVKFTGKVAVLFLTVWLDTTFITGKAFIVPATGTFRLAAPADVSTTLPDIFPGGSDADDRT